MPSYEIAVIVRSALDRPQLKDVMKSACKHIIKEGGLVKQMENLGHRELPHPAKAHSMKHTHGHYFCIQFDSGTKTMSKIAEIYKQTPEIVRIGIVKLQPEPRRPCLDGPCLFGELPNPDHDKTAYKRRVLQRFKNKEFSHLS